MIEIAEISKRYHDVKAVSDVSFTIPKGSIFGFLGPNGAGKTTLLRMLTGLILPDEGQLLINGEALNKDSISRIGYLPEERGLYQKMKVGEQAIYLTCMKGMKRKVAEKELRKWFEKLNISDRWNKQLNTLSKGMQQKIQFIIAVVHHQDLLILDEPFSGLDPINQTLIGKEILELNQAGTTIILSTHNMNSVEQFCDEIVLLNKGHVVLSGKVNEIKQARKSFLYEFGFKENDDFFKSQCELLGAKVIVSDKNEMGFCFKVQFPNEEKIETLLTTTLKEIKLTFFREIVPSMHDVFVESITHEGDLNL